MAFKAKMRIEGSTATVRLEGELDGRSAPELNELVVRAADQRVERLVLLLEDLSYMSSAGIRSLVFAHQKMPEETEILLVGTRPDVAETIRLTGFDRSIVMRETLEA
ncbi:STAS domain-containing protein [Sphaerisporangium album]|uniref:Anti-sigma factor antagonist n=1 Tax=Sphaerisporangium album TaxID=509200 RepID=A0A367EUV3_9ACTN|nr:anti-sigma factor antagonist [Sphaerisporangium album]RCG21906.1 STAS domain-containing protein [Sphaerisporangium album]